MAQALPGLSDVMAPAAVPTDSPCYQGGWVLRCLRTVTSSWFRPSDLSALSHLTLWFCPRVYFPIFVNVCFLEQTTCCLFQAHSDHSCKHHFLFPRVLSSNYPAHPTSHQSHFTLQPLWLFKASHLDLTSLLPGGRFLQVHLDPFCRESY